MLQAQSPPHPNSGLVPRTGVGGNTPVGSGASISDGAFILMALGIAYAGRKWHGIYKKKAENPL